MLRNLLLLSLFACLAVSSNYSQNKNSNDFMQTGNTFTSKNVRIQFLSPTLVRLEYSSSNKFINAPTAVVLKRDWKPVKISVEKKNGWIILSTQKITLRYQPGKGKFTKDNLKIAWNNAGKEMSWAPGDSDKGNLGGLARSLDGIRKDRLPKFTPGILSKSGYFLLDDSNTPVWDKKSSWIVPRNQKDDQDWYFFVYGRDYQHVLKEYAELCGKIPMVPKYILGGWITDLNYEYLKNSDMVKNYDYSDKNIKNEIMKFRKEGIPLDIMVLDFAWHNYGWKGGYDWSPIFPHPKQFLDWAHENGIKVTLNDHPGYGHESVLSEADSHAAEVRKELNKKNPPKPKFKLDIKKDWKFKTDPENLGELQKWYSPEINDNEWKTISADNAWENQGYPKYDGYAWYRKLVRIPAAAKNDSLKIIFGGVDDAYVLYINGRKAAHFGSPGSSVYNTLTYTNILPYVKFGEKNLIAVRVHDWGGYGGIYGNPVEISDKIPEGGIRFNLADKHQAEVFMRVLHDPLINEGVDFWWIDGGSGSCNMNGLNPQMWTNRVYYDFTQKDTKKRAFVFSRYGGWGNNRYPGMFTGDTHSQWTVLNYEVPFTARGGNVLMPYITHDIGGFLGKKIDFDLYARWVEFGALSPILRLHSAFENPEDGNLRMPWTYGQKGIDVVKKYFRLRYSLIPYIYTYCRIAHDNSLPIVRPLYLEYPSLDKAYNYPGEYFFGKEILVAPVTKPGSKTEIYLPPGEWYDYFTGEKYNGDEVLHKNYAVDEIPMFVKAGSVIPTQPVRAYINEKPLDSLTVNIYGSKSGKFDLYNDDGISLSYNSGKFARTPISYSNVNDAQPEVNIGPTKGNYKGQVRTRTYTIKIHGINKPYTLQFNGKMLNENNNDSSYWKWDKEKSILNIMFKPVNIREKINIRFK